MKSALASFLVVLPMLCAGWSAENGSPFVQVPAAHFQQSGDVPAGISSPDSIILAHPSEDIGANVALDFDLESVAHQVTPLARLQLGVLKKVPVKLPGRKNTGERGALHIFATGPTASAPDLAGSTPVKPGGAANAYMIDVTLAVNEALAQPAGQRKLHLEARLTGKPLPYEIYALAAGEGKAPPVLEIASPENWTEDTPQRLAPLFAGPLVYRESCLPITENRDQEVALPLLFPAKRIVEVTANATGEKLEEGRDWILRDGRLILPAGSQAPVQLAAEFFSNSHIDKATGAVKNLPTAVRLMEGTWFHQRQIEVSYEPAARDWSWPAPASNLEQLPRLRKLLAEKAPVTIILFGDSISAGYNASKFTGVWPFQPCWGELVAHQLGHAYESKITFMNHSRAGATSAFAATQAESQVAWFHPDLVLLAYGMNDRAEGRREAHRANTEKIIDIVRTHSPETEFLIVTSMLNNPKQPTGLDPALFIHDEVLKIARPGVAFADMTTAHLELLKHKSYLDLSGNGANHPNDFLHRVYAQRVLEVLASR